MNHRNKKTTSRGKQRKGKSTAKKFWKTFLLCFLIEVLVVGAIAGIFIYDRVMNQNIGGGDDLMGTLSVVTEGEVRNLLILGTDKSGLRSDVMMVLSVYPEKNAMSLLSVPRDTKVKVNGSTVKINAALQIGGERLAVETVRDLLSIPIHDYMVVNFEAVETIIDELGGIRFDVPCDMFYSDPDQGLYINIRAGEQLLNGEDSVKVLRFRQYPMGDLQRNQVQQDFFRAAFQQKFQAQYIGKVPAIYSLINQNIRSNLSLNEVLGYLNTVKAMDNCAVQTFELPVTISDPYVIINRKEAELILDEYYR